MAEHKTVTLDVRPIISKEKHAAIFSTFDSLITVDTLLLIHGHDPSHCITSSTPKETGILNGHRIWSQVQPGRS